ncbi:MAG: hypothetical protein ABJQ29_05060 [Luteolibacter sp.]
MLDHLLALIFTNQWIVFATASSLLLAAAESGYRFGISARRKSSKKAEGHSGAVQGSVLGLLGLLLGFSFAMAVARNDTRRNLAVEEANAIGTTWLRADFVGEQKAKQVHTLLRHYSELRIDAYGNAKGEENFLPLKEQAVGIQQKLWNIAREAAEESPNPVTMGFVNSVNETIDIQSRRLAARRDHVPGAVWLLLFSVAGCGAWSSGYGSGSNGHRSIFSQFVFPVLIGVVITLISDIDRPREGIIGVSQQPLVELLDSMESSAR